MPGFSVITQIQLATYFRAFKAELWLQNLLSSRFKWYLVHWHPDYCHQSSGFTITNIIATLSSQSSPTSQASFTIIRLFWQQNTRMKLKSDIKNCEVFFCIIERDMRTTTGTRLPLRANKVYSKEHVCLSVRGNENKPWTRQQLAGPILSSAS